MSAIIFTSQRGYDAADKTTRYPVFYYLHGGRPGGESKNVTLTDQIHQHIESGAIQPTNYVFPNGGPLSWYDTADKENGLGETTFVKELLPHIDATYQTIGRREGLAIEGFSQGGRGTTRIAFKFPERFVSAAPGGSGYESEMRIRDNAGKESEHLTIVPATKTVGTLLMPTPPNQTILN